jgi:23S rRNA-/tRNA-specific pseudouridylate synthase
MLAPVAWQNTSRNLQAAIESSIAARDFWAQSRGLKFLRHVHRLDADTSGVLLFAKSPGAVKRFFDLFENRKMEKTYLAVVVGEPKQNEWTCELKLAPDKKRFRKMKVDSRHGKNAETHFRVLQSRPRSDVAAGVPSVFGVRRHVGALESGDMSPQSTSGSRARSPHQSKAFKTGADKLTLIECKPVTGRTHQIRIHLAESGLPVVGDELYGREDARLGLGLRAVRLAYTDPFTRRWVEIRAPMEDFLQEYGFDICWYNSKVQHESEQRRAGVSPARDERSETKTRSR